MSPMETLYERYLSVYIYDIIMSLLSQECMMNRFNEMNIKAILKKIGDVTRKNIVAFRNVLKKKKLHPNISRDSPPKIERKSDENKERANFWA